MYELLQRIKAAWPNPIELDDKDYAALLAFVKMRGKMRTEPRPRLIAEWQAYARRQEEELRPFRLTLDFNRNARALAASRLASGGSADFGAPQAAPANKAGSPRRRGRNRTSDVKQDARIAQAKQLHGLTNPELAREFKVTVEEVELALDRHRKR